MHIKVDFSPTLREAYTIKKSKYRFYRIMDNRIPNRIVIYTKDIQNITGRKERTARKLMSELKRKVGKQEYGFLTVEEFCKLTGFKEEQIRPFLK